MAKFLVESYADSSIVKNLWENYGIQYSSGDIVSIKFPLHDNAVQQSTQQNYNLSDAYRQYAIWRYFTVKEVYLICILMNHHHIALLLQLTL